jgi:hypothetical protein
VVLKALAFSFFTTKTDVWAFGIFMYEVFTKAALPYAKWSNSRVQAELEKGYRLPAPRGCPLELYEMMMDTWHPEPEYRPYFVALFHKLSQMKATQLTLPTEADMLRLQHQYEGHITSRKGSSVPLQTQPTVLSLSLSQRKAYEDQVSLTHSYYGDIPARTGDSTPQPRHERVSSHRGHLPPRSVSHWSSTAFQVGPPPPPLPELPQTTELEWDADSLAPALVTPMDLLQSPGESRRHRRRRPSKEELALLGKSVALCGGFPGLAPLQTPWTGCGRWYFWPSRRQLLRVLFDHGSVSLLFNCPVFQLRWRLPPAPLCSDRPVWS